MSMKSKMLRKAKATGLLCGACTVFGIGVGGNCIPENFWIDTWNTALSTTADFALDTYVVTPVTDIIAGNVAAE